MPKSILKPVFVDLPVLPQQLCAPVDLLWSRMLKTFQILTSSQPELTIFCWLCYYAINPFYEDVGFMSKYKESERDTACIWSQEKNLTIQTISGQGTCLGKVPLSHQHICNQNTLMVHSKWVISPWTGMVGLFNRVDSVCAWRGS